MSLTVYLWSCQQWLYSLWEAVVAMLWAPRKIEPPTYSIYVRDKIDLPGLVLAHLDLTLKFNRDVHSICESYAQDMVQYAELDMKAHQFEFDIQQLEPTPKKISKEHHRVSPVQRVYAPLSGPVARVQKASVSSGVEETGRATTYVPTIAVEKRVQEEHTQPLTAGSKATYVLPFVTSSSSDSDASAAVAVRTQGTTTVPATPHSTPTPNNTPLDMDMDMDMDMDLDMAMDVDVMDTREDQPFGGGVEEEVDFDLDLSDADTVTPSQPSQLSQVSQVYLSDLATNLPVTPEVQLRHGTKRRLTVSKSPRKRRQPESPFTSQKGYLLRDKNPEVCRTLKCKESPRFTDAVVHDPTGAVIQCLDVNHNLKDQLSSPRQKPRSLGVNVRTIPIMRL